MLANDFQNIGLSFYLRGPTDTPETLEAILVALESHSLFTPTHFGSDERKRHVYDRSQAIQAALNGLSASPQISCLLLWSKQSSRPSPIMLDVSPNTPVSLDASIKSAFVDKPALCFEQYRSLVERLRPHFASLWPRPVGKRYDELVPESTKKALRALGTGLGIGEIRRVGFSSMDPHAYLDEELGVALEPALADLGARRASFGGWWIGAEDAPLAPGVVAVTESSLRLARVLHAHGLLGRRELGSGNYYYGPRWTPPPSWTAVVSPLVERDLKGPNV